jgi:HME family heavy-metal exporter
MTVIVFQLFGLTINTMTLGGLAIAIGELVDDAVVGVENVFRRLRENGAKAEPAPALAVIAQASQEVRSGIIYATAIIILVFVPLFALSGIEGRLFAPLGVAYIVSILASLVTSITLTPVLCYYLLPQMRSLGHGDTRLVRMLKAGNRRLLDWAFGQQAFVMVAAVFAVGIAAFSATLLPRSFLPPFNEGTLTISMLLRPGISLAESNRVGLIAERLILQVPEVRTVGRRTGRAELDEHAEGVHSAEIDVDPSAGRSREESVTDIRSCAFAMLPAAVNVGQPICIVSITCSGVRAQIALKIIRGGLRHAAQLPSSCRTAWPASGLVDLQVERQVRIPQVQVASTIRRLACSGSPAHVTEALETCSMAVVRRSSMATGATTWLRVADPDRTTEASKLWSRRRRRVPLSSFAQWSRPMDPIRSSATTRGAHRRAGQHRWLRHGADHRPHPGGG